MMGWLSFEYFTDPEIVKGRLKQSKVRRNTNENFICTLPDHSCYGVTIYQEDTGTQEFLSLSRSAEHPEMAAS